MRGSFVVSGDGFRFRVTPDYSPVDHRPANSHIEGNMSDAQSAMRAVLALYRLPVEDRQVDRLVLDAL